MALPFYVSRTQWKLLEPKLEAAGIPVAVTEKPASRGRTEFELTVKERREEVVRLVESLAPEIKALQPKYAVWVVFFEDGSRDGWIAVAVETEAEARRKAAGRLDDAKITRVLSVADYEEEFDEVLDPESFPAPGQSVVLEYGS